MGISQELNEAIFELSSKPEITHNALKIAALLMQEPKVFSHGPDSVVLNWTDGLDNFYLTVTETGASVLLSTPKRIVLR